MICVSSQMWHRPEAKTTKVVAAAESRLCGQKYQPIFASPASNDLNGRPPGFQKT